MKLPKEELEERVAVLKRFRELLARQRDKFRDYMVLLDNQKGDIESGDIDALVSHVELEESIVSEIYSVQKAINPMEDMYRAFYKGKEAEGIAELQSTLSTLTEEVAVRNAENRNLLKARMGLIRNEIMRLNNPYSKKRSIYAQEAKPHTIDISR